MSRLTPEERLLRRQARIDAYCAVQSGRIKPREACEDCGRKTKLQKHHPDYSKPLDILWLCFKCHLKAHKRLAGPHRGVCISMPKKLLTFALSRADALGITLSAYIVRLVEADRASQHIRVGQKGNTLWPAFGKKIA